MKVMVASHLWREGFRRISFEKPFQLSDGSTIYVDVYEGDQKLCVECEFQPTLNDVIARASRIRQAEPEAKYVLAIHDTKG